MSSLLCPLLWNSLTLWPAAVSPFCNSDLTLCMHATHWTRFLVLLINFSCAYLLFLLLHCKTEGKIVFLLPSLSPYLPLFPPFTYLFFFVAFLVGGFWVSRTGLCTKQGLSGTYWFLPIFVISAEWWSNCLPCRFIFSTVIFLRKYYVGFFSFSCLLSIYFLKMCNYISGKERLN